MVLVYSQASTIQKSGPDGKQYGIDPTNSNTVTLDLPTNSIPPTLGLQLIFHVELMPYYTHSAQITKHHDLIEVRPDRNWQIIDSINEINQTKFLRKPAFPAFTGKAPCVESGSALCVKKGLLLHPGSTTTTTTTTTHTFLTTSFLLSFPLIKFIRRRRSSTVRLHRICCC